MLYKINLSGINFSELISNLSYLSLEKTNVNQIIVTLCQKVFLEKDNFNISKDFFYDFNLIRKRIVDLLLYNHKWFKYDFLHCKNVMKNYTNVKIIRFLIEMYIIYVYFIKKDINLRMHLEYFSLEYIFVLQTNFNEYCYYCIKFNNWTVTFILFVTGKDTRKSNYCYLVPKSISRGIKLCNFNISRDVFCMILTN